MENFFRRLLIPIWLFNAITWTWFLGGCDPARNYPMVRTEKVEISSIVWIDKKPTECGNAEGDILGCTVCIKGKALCTITMPWDSPDYVIAHEFRHAFGAEHAYK